MSKFNALALSLAAMALASGVLAAEPAAKADTSKGDTVARNVMQNICARCHDTSSTLKVVPPRVSGVAPAFLRVAADPAMDHKRLVKFLTFPHGDMDNVYLTRRETSDLADYILSLRGK